MTGFRAMVGSCNLIELAPVKHLKANSGDAGVMSNAKEMAIWLQALLGKGRHPTQNKTIIPAEVIRRVSSGVVVSQPVAQFPEDAPKVYGGGQSRGTYRGFEYIEHGGAVWGIPFGPI
ncbi:hypothetical protein B0H16DRAFT_1743981 [Mycena metata]|uniref:Uncharacterized protein n=1 Tax=Mycena metata TaxID=1033252 RepID=A0AAD7MDX0_9AGAR|nr:hypothetical protein B0H16DRAFT_1743981 [Mycena metata]